MQSKLVGGGDGTPRMWVVVLASGEEVKATLLSFAASEQIGGASFVGFGAFARAVVAYFDWERKAGIPIQIPQQVEVLSLVGDIVRGERGGPDLHAHTVLGLPDGTTRGGHLMEGHVRPTLDVTLTETPAHLVRRMRPELGTAIIDIG